ncbi:mast cell protease 1A-like [Cimex lectularius]|uniref:Peptidase S1 domain-containing protein n=1 Tax=Cimex lectularius TaxID=79782 RepID=A0A8I6RJW0_CIMLE|nr:mast cell protease 1A-like [Cimex lectularius]
MGRCFIIFLLFPAMSWTGNNDTIKVIGGREAYEGEFPYVVCVVGDNRCGGTLVTLDRFITAGHCFHYKGDAIDLSNVLVLAGSIDIQLNKEGYQSRKVAMYLMHHEYHFKEDTTSFHDIALAQVDNSFVPSDTLKPINLFSKEPRKFKKGWDDLVSKGSLCRSMGWGLKRVEIGPHEVVLSNVLRTFEFTPWPNKKCRELSKLGEDMTEHGEICAATTVKGEMLGTGDSGCPLICEGLAFGINIARATLNESNNVERFILFWPYVNYFELPLL